MQSLILYPLTDSPYSWFHVSPAAHIPPHMHVILPNPSKSTFWESPQPTSSLYPPTLPHLASCRTGLLAGFCLQTHCPPAVTTDISKVKVWLSNLKSFYVSSLFYDNSQTPQQGTQPCMLHPHHPKHVQPEPQHLSIICRLCGEACYFIYKLRDQQNGFWVRQHNGECGQNGGKYPLPVWSLLPSDLGHVAFLSRKSFSF